MGYAETRIRMLETARDCVRLGARQRTIAWITGLPSSFILRKVFDGPHLAPKGRPPYTEDFLFRATLKVQGEISIFAARYRQLTAAGFAPAQSLITAYRHHITVVAQPAFCFDEAFFVASMLDGIWAAPSPVVDIAVCDRCGCRRIVALGPKARMSCPFCTVYSAGSRLGAVPAGDTPLSAANPVSHGTSTKLDRVIERLRLHRQLEDLGAHPRIIEALAPDHCDGPAAARAGESMLRLRIGKPLPTRLWGSSLRVLGRAQFSIVAIEYSRLRNAGFAPADALRAAYVHARSLFGDTSLSFNRCFKVISLLEARWGVCEQELELISCGDCGSGFLVSRLDRRPAFCPFCVLARSARHSRQPRGKPHADSANGTLHDGISG